MSQSHVTLTETILRVVSFLKLKEYNYNMINIFTCQCTVKHCCMYRYIHNIIAIVIIIVRSFSFVYAVLYFIAAIYIV